MRAPNSSHGTIKKNNKKIVNLRVQLCNKLCWGGIGLDVSSIICSSSGERSGAYCWKGAKYTAQNVETKTALFRANTHPNDFYYISLSSTVPKCLKTFLPYSVCSPQYVYIKMWSRTCWSWIRVVYTILTRRKCILGLKKWPPFFPWNHITKLKLTSRKLRDRFSPNLAES